MISIENHLGTTEISETYFSSLVGKTVSSCFGVAAMADSGTRQELRSKLMRKKDYRDKGVAVRKSGDGIDIDVHIVVSYGLNIKAVADSIINKVKYTVEKATALPVYKVNVFVDAMEKEEND